MVSDGDYDAYGDRVGSRYLATATSRPVRLKPALSRRQAIYRRLGQMFMRWAETNAGRD